MFLRLLYSQTHLWHKTIRIAETSAGPSAFGRSYGYYPNNSVIAGDIWFSLAKHRDPIIGNNSYFVFGHELGHAIGMPHGHKDEHGIGGAAMDFDRDSHEFSIMTYHSYVGGPEFYTNGTWDSSQSLMMYDIRAIQHMYGANFNTNSNNTTYTFSTATGEMFINGVGQGVPGANRIFRTIWDGNGIDTYNFSNYTTNLSINLTPGGWSDLDTDGLSQKAYLGDGNFARGHVFNALQFEGDSRSLIENANGGSGNDRIQGNSAANNLNGGLGQDTLRGERGDD